MTGGPMIAITDWATASALATAAGTLVLALATFASVRSANRAARVAERSLRVNLRPVLTQSRLEDPPQRIMFGDRHWVAVEGGHAAVELEGDTIYLAMPLRNLGNGMAVIEAWLPLAGQLVGDFDWRPEAQFRQQARALWVPPGDVGFWQGALRDPSEPVYPPIYEAVHDGALTVDLLYRDHEGGQRIMSRFTMVRRDDSGADELDHAGWWVNISRHRDVDFS